MKADKGLWKLPIAIISNGQYGQETRVFVSRECPYDAGYLVASIRKDLTSDPP